MSEVIATDPAKGPVCGCLERLRRTLRAQNGEPGTCRQTGAVFVFVRRIDREQPAPPMLAASFCPFCGEAYE
jgi:hypothetical protein